MYTPPCASLGVISMIFKNKKRSKIFCIGLHKTGTTSIEKVLTNLNYKIGDQVQGELLLDNWYRRDFDSIIEFSKSAEAFQDTPFSLPFTFIALDQYFENAKFILSVRDDPEQWYNSLTKFHSKKWGFGQNPPTLDQLKEADLHNVPKFIHYYLSSRTLRMSRRPILRRFVKTGVK